MKLGRKCQLKLEIDPAAVGDVVEGQNTLTIPRNATVEFEVSRQFLSSSQEATFRVFNLGEKTRNLINKDAYALNEFRAVQFRAGYEEFPIPLVFNGYMRSASSYRRGSDVITEIHAYDGGLAMANGFTSRTFAAGTSVRDLIVSLARSLPGVAGQPIVGAFPGSSLRGQALLGNTWSLILEQSGNLATIDNGQVKALALDEAIEGGIPLIDSSTGLLGTPRRTPTNLEFDLLFEPRLTVGQILQLESSFNKLYNGTYKVAGFDHRGTAPSTGPDPGATVNPVVSGEAISTVSLFFGVAEFQIVQGEAVL